jgi:hypothetical protein
MGLFTVFKGRVNVAKGAVLFLFSMLCPQIFGDFTGAKFFGCGTGQR